MRKLLLMVVLCLPWGAHADLRVFACEPEWAALTTELGGGNVEVFSATTALQDTHRIEARPSLIAKMRRADLVVCTGAGLESGWLPQLLRSAGNRKVQPGQSGYFEAAAVGGLLDVPVTVDRAQGDIHPEGNPHLHLDPHRIGRVAVALSERLVAVDARHADRYRQARADFLRRWQAAMPRWEREAASLKGMPVIVHHRNFAYLADWLGLRIVGTLEPKPGLPPSAAHLAGLLRQLKAQPARVIARAPYEEARASEWLGERSGVKVIVLPYTVGAEGADSLFSLFDITIARLRGVAS